MEQLNSNIERVIEHNSTIEVFNVGAFYALVKAYKYVVVDNKPVKEKINVPFSFDLYDKDNEKISTGTISPGEKATFKVPTYKMIINNTYDYDVHIVYSFGSGTVSQLKTDLEMTTEDIAALTQYDKQDFDQLVSINQQTTDSYEELDKITRLIEAQTALDKTPELITKHPIFIPFPLEAYTYFSAFDLALKYGTGRDRPYFITHIDIAFDYSQCIGPTSDLIVTNTFNPAMSFGKYRQLKDLQPDTVANWNNYKWTDRADNGLPTRSKSLVITGGKVTDDGYFRVEINERYGNLLNFNIYNFILKTNIVSQARIGGLSRTVAIRKYTDVVVQAPAGITENKLEGNYNFSTYNQCTTQKPIRTANTNMIVVDVSVYGYMLEQDLEDK